MIGLLAAAALLGLSVWLLADWWFVPARRLRPREPLLKPVSDRLEALGQVLVEAELEQWRPGAVVLWSGAIGLVTGVATFQTLGWLVPALCWALGLGSLPFVYIWRKREQLRAARTAQLAPLLERARDELAASQGLQQVLGILAARGPAALQPALRRLAQDLSRHHDLAVALEASRRRLADPIWDHVVASLLLSHASGGSLSEVLEHLAASVPREGCRAHLRGEPGPTAGRRAGVRSARTDLSWLGTGQTWTDTGHRAGARRHLVVHGSARRHAPRHVRADARRRRGGRRSLRDQSRRAGAERACPGRPQPDLAGPAPEAPAG